MPTGTNAVVLQVDDEDDLRALSERLHAGPIKHVRIEESDEPYAGQMMALGLELVKDRKQVRRYLSSLPLLT